MPSSVAVYDKIEPVIGVQPSIDKTNFNTVHWTYSDKIRFHNNSPEVIGGWEKVLLDYGQSIIGVPRSYWSQFINGALYTLIGTHKCLYVFQGSSATNITPLETSSTAAANSLSTLYGTLANNPISTTNGSNLIVISDASASRFRVGDSVTLSGAATTGGILNTALNTTHIIRAIGTNTFTIRVASNATSTVAGGGAAVVRSCGLIRVTVANTMFEGGRVKLSGAIDTGGVTAVNINAEFIIRNVSGTLFDVMTNGLATSSVTGGGGASTVFFPQIASGEQDESVGQGYGMGRYGVGNYGVNKTSSSSRKYPRIWQFDRFGDYMLMSAGNGTKLYYWGGSTAVAPVQVTGSPNAINYFFVSDNTVVTFGNAGNENRITACDQGDLFGWTASAVNQVYDDNIEGAGRLLGHIHVNGTNLIGTENKVYSFRHIGLPNVWEIIEVGKNCGFISSNCGFEVNNIGYWMSLGNWYMWAGGNVEVVPANSQVRSTIIRYVMSDINTSQKSKIYCWFNRQFEELRWHYPSSSSMDPDRVAVLNVTDKSWWPDTISRTCAERPEITSTYPHMMDSLGNIYLHEYGTDADGAALSWTLSTNLRTLGKKEARLSAFIPDSFQTGAVSVKIDMYQWPQSTALTSTKTYTVSADNKRVEVTQQGRFWKYTISGSVVGGFWNMGNWAEEKQESGDGQ